MRCFFGVLGAGIILGIVVLYLMSFGVLVRYSTGGYDELVCQYFVGTEVAPVTFSASQRVCPRLYRF